MKSTMKKRYILDLLQQLLKIGLQIIRKISTTSNTAKNTELSKYIWLLKDAKIPYNSKRSIVEKVYGKTKIDRCPLCLAEKLHLVVYFDDIQLLKKILEFINHFRHQNKLLLKTLQINDSMD